MTEYRTFKTSMGHKIRVKMSPAEIRERKIFTALVVLSPFAMCWLFAAFARMI